MGPQMPLLAMNRNEEFRLDQREHHLMLLLAGVAGSVNFRIIAVNHFRALAE